MLHLPRFLRSITVTPTSRAKKPKPREVKGVAHSQLASDRRQGWTLPLSAESSGLFADTREALHLSWTVVLRYHASFTSKCDFFILMRSPLSIPRSSLGTIYCSSLVWGSEVNVTGKSFKASVSDLDAPSLPSKVSAQPLWRVVRIFSGYEPPSRTSLLFFKPKHQCCVHTHTCHTHFSTLSTSNIASISKESKGFSESMKVDVHNSISDSAVFPGLFHFLQVIPSWEMTSKSCGLWWLIKVEKSL